MEASKSIDLAMRVDEENVAECKVERGGKFRQEIVCQIAMFPRFV